MGALRLLLVAAVFLAASLAQRVGVPTDDLTKVGVEELFTVQITSVGRKSQQLSKAPAAVFVLTAEDIRRSGATSIPEALQWVPGLTVLRIDGRSWSISARGSSRQYANKILVMIDGRSLYTPLFAGVIWDAIDLPLEDIEQIEVMRGPGAVMWGPNAMNGVINIITHNARATTGLLTSVTTGNELKAQTTSRWGAAPSDKFAYRIWTKADYTTGYSSPGHFLVDSRYALREALVGSVDRTAGRIGFRLDGQPDKKDQWLVQGDLFKSTRQDPQIFAVIFPVAIDKSQSETNYVGGYLQARWIHSSSAGNESSAQFFYARDHLDYPFIHAINYDLTADFQNRIQTGERNEVYWGLGYQQYGNANESIRFIQFDPQKFRFKSGDAVIRDEWQFVPGRLMGSAGMRLDYTSYGHLEYQPSLRLLLTPSPKQSSWISLSRALRLPSRFDRDIHFDGGSVLAGDYPIAITAVGSKTALSEVVRSLEAGYRFQSGQLWSIDASAFASLYSRLFVFQEPTTPVVSFSGGPVPTFSIPTSGVNGGKGRSYGTEISATWQVRTGWRLMPSYSFLHENWRLPASTATTAYEWQAFPSSVPHQALLRSQHDLSRAWKIDVMARLRSANTAFALPAAVLLDARLSWKSSPTSELSFTLKDLTNRHALESYAESPTPGIPTRRTFVVSWTYRL